MEYSCRVCCSTGKLSNRSWSIIVPVSVATMIVPAPLSPVKLEKIGWVVIAAATSA